MMVKLVGIILVLLIVRLVGSNLALLINRSASRYYFYTIIEKAIYK